MTDFLERETLLLVRAAMAMDATRTDRVRVVDLGGYSGETSGYRRWEIRWGDRLIAEVERSIRRIGDEWPVKWWIFPAPAGDERGETLAAAITAAAFPELWEGDSATPTVKVEAHGRKFSPCYDRMENF